MSARLEGTGNIRTLCAAYFISAAPDSEDEAIFYRLSHGNEGKV